MNIEYVPEEKELTNEPYQQCFMNSIVFHKNDEFQHSGFGGFRALWYWVLWQYHIIIHMVCTACYYYLYPNSVCVLNMVSAASLPTYFVLFGSRGTRHIGNDNLQRPCSTYNLFRQLLCLIVFWCGIFRNFNTVKYNAKYGIEFQPTHTRERFVVLSYGSSL